MQAPQQAHGDLAGGVTAAAAVILILAFLFGRGDGKEAQLEDGVPGTVSTVHETPIGGDRDPEPSGAQPNPGL